MDHSIQTRGSNLILVDKKKRTFSCVDFAFPADPLVNINGKQKLNKFLDIFRVLKMVRIFGKIPKNLEKR